MDAGDKIPEDRLCERDAYNGCNSATREEALAIHQRCYGRSRHRGQRYQHNRQQRGVASVVVGVVLDAKGGPARGHEGLAGGVVTPRRRGRCTLLNGRRQTHAWRLSGIVRQRCQ